MGLLGVVVLIILGLHPTGALVVLLVVVACLCALALVGNVVVWAVDFVANRLSRGRIEWWVTTTPYRDPGGNEGIELRLRSWVPGEKLHAPRITVVGPHGQWTREVERTIRLVDEYPDPVPNVRLRFPIDFEQGASLVRGDYKVEVTAWSMDSSRRYLVRRTQFRWS